MVTLKCRLEVPFESTGVVSYSPVIVTMALPCIVCEMYSDLLVENRDIFNTPPVFNDPERGDPVGIL